jgi:two-component system sensor histidine kinase ArlS
MKIKYRITILFSIVVTLILLIVCVSIYYFSDLNRQKDFTRRIQNRAITTANLLLKVEGIDTSLLQKIDETTMITIKEKSVVIYNDRMQKLYQYADSNTTAATLDSMGLEKAINRGDYHFTDGSKEGLVINYSYQNRRYILVASAIDKSGLEKLSQLRLILMISFFSGILITVISGSVFSVNIVAPIQHITREVKAISSQNLTRRIKLSKSKDEIHELSATFNDLLTRLEESFDIQRHFIANASHELSTPLTSILSQLEITLQNERSAKEYEAVLRSVHEDVRNLTQLTRSLLEIAKATGTTNGMELALVRMDELIMKLPAELKKIESSFHAQLHFDSFPDNEDGLLIFGNPDLLYSAIRNIAINACKYSPDHLANISLHFSDDFLMIKISDNGPGISEEDKKMIFQPFFRTSETSHIHGFGLGLPLALRIINLHKGTIDIETAPGKGTSFRICLPIAQRFHKA